GGHSRRERRMAACRVAAYDEPFGIEVVLLGMRDHPPQRAAAVFDRGRRERDVREAVLHVYDRIAHAEKAQSSQEARFFRAADPPAAVDVDDGGNRRLRPPRVHVELSFPPVCPLVHQIWTWTHLLEQ